jgi:glycosyltransferase involved in cell wall biosynthesis
VLGVEGEAKSLLEEAEAGVAITPENASELAAAVRELADDPGRAGRLGRQGRDFAAANFDRAKLASDYLDLLCSVIARHGRTNARGPVAVPGPPTG